MPGPSHLSDPSPSCTFLHSTFNPLIHYIFYYLFLFCLPPIVSFMKTKILCFAHCCILMPRIVPGTSKCWINMDWVNRGSFSLFKVKAARNKLSFYLSNVPSTVAELCARYEQNEEEMVGEFVAFLTSTQKDCLSTETVDSFEREVRAQCKGLIV